MIEGSDEKAKGEVQIKDLIEGARAAAAIASNQEWRESRPAQFAVAEAKLIEAVREVLGRHGVTWAGFFPPKSSYRRIMSPAQSQGQRQG